MWFDQAPCPFFPSSSKRVSSLTSPVSLGQCSEPPPPALPPSSITGGVTYIENEEGIGTAVELGQLVPDLVHEVVVTWVACDAGGVDRGDGEGAPCPVFPVQNQQQGDDSWEQATVSHERMGRTFLIFSGTTASSPIFPWPGLF